MTDRYYALTVVLDSNIREDDAQEIIDAIKVIGGVLSVAPEVSDIETYAALERARRELLTKLLKVLE
jgi:hypothetical protein